VETRLRSFSARVQSFLAGAERDSVSGDAPDDDDLESASDDEILELIDKEFGSS
jgi:hypothetical protein